MLDDLNDVTITSPTTGQLLQLNGSGQWVNVNELDAVTGIETPEYIQFDTTHSQTSAVAKIMWDDGEGTFTFGLKGGNIDLDVGQQQVQLAYNGTGSTITKGKVVIVDGAQGQRVSIKLADADTEPLSSKTMGVVAEDIANGAEGFIVTQGVVRNVDTSAFSAGASLYLSSTAGGVTATKPSAPTHMVFIGWVLKSHASSGRIFVHVQNGFELEELHNVSLTSPASGDFLKYNGSLWVNDPIDLGTDTVGNYVSSVSAGNGIAVTGTAGEGWTPTVATKFVGAKAYRSSNLSRANNSFVNISFNAEEYDTNGFFTPTSSTMTIPSGFAGYYNIQGSVEYATNATGLREAGIQLNGTNITYVFQNNAGSVFGTIVNLSATVYLAVGDTVALDSYQNSGGALNIQGSSLPSRTWLAITYLGS